MGPDNGKAYIICKVGTDFLYDSHKFVALTQVVSRWNLTGEVRVRYRVGLFEILCQAK